MLDDRRPCTDMKKIKVNTEKQPNRISNELLDVLLKDYKNPSDLLGEDGIIKQLTKRAIERIMEAELDYHLDDANNPESGRETGNSRNGKGRDRPCRLCKDASLDIPSSAARILPG